MTTETINITLTKPVAGPEGEITELKFREPTGADIERHGNPVHIRGAGSDDTFASYDAKSMSGMLAALAGVVPVVIGRLSANDWNSAAWAVSGFFVPIPGTVS